MKQVIITAQAMFKNLQRANCIKQICDDLSIATKVLHSKLKSDEATVQQAMKNADEMQDFITEQYAKYSKDEQPFALAVQKTRAFIHVFGKYEEECETVRHLYTDLINQQNDVSRMINEVKSKVRAKRRKTKARLVA